jgi:hypothetical protein
MIIRSITTIVAVVGIIALCSPAKAGVLDVFSFFKKKDKSVPITIAPAVGATLKEEVEFPKVDASVATRMQCKKMRTEGKLPDVRFYGDKTYDTNRLAFVVSGLTDGRSIAVINDPDNHCFNFWQLDPESFTPVKIIETGKLDPRQENWFINWAVSASCLPNDQLLITVHYRNPHPRDRLYLFDMASMNIKWSAQVENRTWGDDFYYSEYKILSEDAALVLYYTDQRRKRAEFYHNYLNHIMLFSSDYPDGIEVLKLSIDIGNILKWGVVGKTLYMHTIDTRPDPKPTRHGFWSLDLSNVLK